MILAIILLVVAIALSGFFSGTETGLYRVTKVRLVLDALDGDWIARALLWLTNRPSLFVATVLVGNNLANYLASLALVIGVGAVYSGDSYVPELLAPIVFSPIIFIYGELAPKHLFYQAPYRLLRASGPALLLCTVLFAPISGILWGLTKILQLFVQLFAKEVPQQVRLALARRELQRVFEEGHEAGILVPAQRSLVQGLLGLAAKPIRQFATPAARLACAIRPWTSPKFSGLPGVIAWRRFRWNCNGRPMVWPDTSGRSTSISTVAKTCR